MARKHRLYVVILSLVLSACKQSSEQAKTPPPPPPPPSQTSQTPAKTKPDCDKDYLGGRPTATEDATGTNALELLCHQAYEVMFNPATLDPVTSSEHLTRQQMEGSQPRTEEFSPDPVLPESEQVNSREYSHSGYDRGHLSPAADFKGLAADAMAESFYTSNIAPQNPTFNREGWQAIENMTRACARQEDVYVVTGVVARPDGDRIHDDGPVIPTAYWKVVYTDSDYRAVMMSNVETPKLASYRQYYLSLSQLEKQTGVTVAPDLKLKRDQPGTLCRASFS